MHESLRKVSNASIQIPGVLRSRFFFSFYYSIIASVVDGMELSHFTLETTSNELLLTKWAF
jgi:hypothetical protein